MADTSGIGRKGEQAAAVWLERNGFEILARNWRHGRYELDIVALKDGELRIVEVKCRAGDGLTLPEDAITPAKFLALQTAAQAYIDAHGIDADVRFDLMAVTHCGGKFTVEYVPDAMVPVW